MPSQQPDQNLMNELRSFKNDLDDLKKIKIQAFSTTQQQPNNLLNNILPPTNPTITTQTEPEPEQQQPVV